MGPIWIGVRIPKIPKMGPVRIPKWDPMGLRIPKIPKRTRKVTRDPNGTPGGLKKSFPHTDSLPPRPRRVYTYKDLWDPKVLRPAEGWLVS